MFSLREFVKMGFLDAVGKLGDYQIILNAAGWLEKGVLTQADLADLQAAIDAHAAAREEETASEEAVWDGIEEGLTDDS